MIIGLGHYLSVAAILFTLGNIAAAAAIAVLQTCGPGS